MGFYTELKFDAKLLRSTPIEIILLLESLINLQDSSIPDASFIDHEFFDCTSWYKIFLPSQFLETQENTLDFQNGRYIISIHSEFKNYDQEIEKFVDWIKPYVIGRKKKQYVGYFRNENSNNKTNIYIER